jgi:hypothetical protein
VVKVTTMEAKTMTSTNEEAKAMEESKVGAQKLTIAVLRRTIREASLVCAALERMGHEAHPFGWSDPEKNAAITGMFFSAIDADEPDVRSEADREIAARRDVLSWLRTRVQFITPAEPSPSLATQLLHDDFALTLEEQTALLDALGCIDRQTTARGHERAVRDSFETILAHVAELQRDALRWRESRKSAEHSDPAVVLGAEGQTGAFVVECVDESPPSPRAPSLGDPVCITKFGQLWSLPTGYEGGNVYGVVVDHGVGSDGVMRWKVCPIGAENDVMAWAEGVERISMREFEARCSGWKDLKTVDGRVYVSVSEAEPQRMPTKRGAHANAFETVPKPLRVGDAVRLAAGADVHTLASGPAHMCVHGAWCDAVIVATETPNGIVTTVVPVAALEVVS